MIEIANFKKKDYLDLLLWFTVIFLYFLPSYHYIFLIDMILGIKTVGQILSREERAINYKTHLFLLTIFTLFSILLFFYNPKFPPFLFLSLILFLILFNIASVELKSLKLLILILPFIAIPYSLIKHQKELSFIYKNNSILGLLFISGLIFFRKNRALFLIFLFSIILTFSKTAFVAAIIFITYFLFSETKLNKKNTFTIIFVIILIFSPLFYKSVKNEPFFGSRIKIWKTALLTGIKNLPFGVGGFNFNFYSDQYKIVKKIKINDNLEFYGEYLNNKIKLNVYNFKRVRFEHNLFIKLFTEYGIIGLIVSLYLLFFLYKTFKKRDYENRYLLLVFFVFSLIQNFSLSYVFLLPALIVIKDYKKHTEKRYLRKDLITSFLLIYFIFFSIPVYLNDILIHSGKLNTAKKVIPFDYRVNYIEFNRTFEKLKEEPTIKNLYYLEIIGKNALIQNKRLKEVYSILAFSFYNFLNNQTGENKFINEKAIYYAKKWVKIDPANPIAILHLGKVYLKSNRINEARFKILEALSIEPFYMDALMNLKVVYFLEKRYHKSSLIAKVIKKISVERINYKFKSSSLYEKIIIGKFNE